ncbi:MAG: hypothetical protein FJ134_13085 [Deltaproteobacteria bacterium]|nr:hypothetical protein [Deltaproteobacteria bacterium]
MVTVVVDIVNGLIEDVSADSPARVIILEQDKYLEEWGSPRFYEDGNPIFFKDYEVRGTGVNPEYVRQIIGKVEQPLCDICLGPRGSEDGHIDDDERHVRMCSDCAAQKARGELEVA